MSSIWKLGHAADFAVSSRSYVSNQSSRVDAYLKYQKRGTSYTPNTGFRQIKVKLNESAKSGTPGAKTFSWQLHDRVRCTILGAVENSRSPI